MTTFLLLDVTLLALTCLLAARIARGIVRRQVRRWAA